MQHPFKIFPADPTEQDAMLAEEAQSVPQELLDNPWVATLTRIRLIGVIRAYTYYSQREAPFKLDLTDEILHATDGAATVAHRSLVYMGYLRRHHEDLWVLAPAAQMDYPTTGELPNLSLVVMVGEPSSTLLEFPELEAHPQLSSFNRATRDGMRQAFHVAQRYAAQGLGAVTVADVAACFSGIPERIAARLNLLVEMGLLVEMNGGWTPQAVSPLAVPQPVQIPEMIEQRAQELIPAAIERQLVRQAEKATRKTAAQAEHNAAEARNAAHRAAMAVASARKAVQARTEALVAARVLSNTESVEVVIESKQHGVVVCQLMGSLIRRRVEVPAYIYKQLQEGKVYSVWMAFLEGAWHWKHVTCLSDYEVVVSREIAFARAAAQLAAHPKQKTAKASRKGLVHITRGQRAKLAGTIRANRRETIYKMMLKRFGGRCPCYVCGEHVSPHEATLEHILPVSKGGTDEMDNLSISHQACNKRRGNADPKPL